MRGHVIIKTAVNTGEVGFVTAPVPQQPGENIPEPPALFHRRWVAARVAQDIADAEGLLHSHTFMVVRADRLPDRLARQASEGRFV